MRFPQGKCYGAPHFGITSQSNCCNFPVLFDITNNYLKFPATIQKRFFQFPKAGYCECIEISKKISN